MIELQTADALPAAYPWPVPSDRTAFVAVADGAVVGAVVGRLELGVATVDRVWSVPGTGLEAEVLAATLRRARGRGAAAVTVEVAASQPALAKLLLGAPVLSTHMTKPVPTTPPPLPPGVDRRAMTADEYAAWERTAVEEYTEGNLERCGGNRELARQRSGESFAELLPDGAATVDSAVLALTLGGARYGDLWLRHHRLAYRLDATPDETFVFDVRVVPERRGQGLGRAAMVVTERLAHAAGDRTIGLNVFSGNHVAIGLYCSHGFTSQSTVHDVSTL